MANLLHPSPLRFCLLPGSSVNMPSRVIQSGEVGGLFYVGCAEEENLMTDGDCHSLILQTREEYNMIDHEDGSLAS